MKKLEGKVAVVTGASRGIGAGIARDLAAAGAAVVVNYAASRDRADKVVAEIMKAGGRAVAVKADLAKKAEIARLFAETKKAFGRLDILVNNAGVYSFAPLEKITEEDYRRMFDLNVLGLLLTTQEAVKHFDEAGGSVINISSIAGTGAPLGAIIYSATKGAVNTITKGLAKELGPRKIRVNGIAPGVVEVSDNPGPPDEDYVRRTAVGRVGEPHDIGTAAVFLASDEASWIAGETLVVSGGYA